MDLILLCFCSVIIARCLEKRMRVASVAHAILFIVLFFFSLFTSGFAMIDQAMINTFGKDLFETVRDTLNETSPVYRSIFGSLFIIDLAIDIMTSIAVIILIIKGFKKFSKVVKLNKAPLIIKNILIKIRLLPNKVLINNNRNQYLVLQQLRN